ncbi:unnamed protein product [Tenebrio molitor]|nr:unnamed protein product [Tenebrio molitor]
MAFNKLLFLVFVCVISVSGAHGGGGGEAPSGPGAALLKPIKALLSKIPHCVGAILMFVVIRKTLKIIWPLLLPLLPLIIPLIAITIASKLHKSAS